MMALPVLLFAAIVVLYIFSSIKILTEYERGVIFRLGKLLPQPKGPGIILVFAPDRPHGAGQPAHRRARRAAAGRHHARQRVGQGERGRLLPRDGSAHARSSRWRTTTTRRRSSRRRRCGACSGRWSSTTCCRSASGSTSSCSRSSTSTPIRGASRCRPSRSSTSICRRDMQRAMARQAEAEREKRAKIIHAAGELEASEKLARAANVIATEPVDDHAALPADADRDRGREELDDHLPAADRAAEPAEAEGRGEELIVSEHGPRPDRTRERADDRCLTTASTRFS